MGDAHGWYESLAVGHVVGGLTDGESASFREHLVACRDCRRRVAELRDIAAGLEATARDEHRRVAVTTDVAAEERGPARADGPRTLPTWALAVAAAGMVVVLVALFWNYHLRRVVDEHAAAVAAQDAVLDTLARGEPLSATGGDGVGVRAARLDDRVAVVLSELDDLPRDGVIVLWLSRGDELIGRRPLVRTPVVGERATVPFAFAADGAATATITVERAVGDVPEEPGPDLLATVDLEPDG